MMTLLKAMVLRRPLRALPILLSLLLMSFIPPSGDWDTDIVKRLKTYQTIYRQEKLYVQTDRPIYVAGEELWFSAFLFEAAAQVPNRTEKVLYVELVRPSGNTAIKQIFKIENGRACGNLALNGKLPGGEYLLVAYTNWMRNVGSEFFFRKNITIVGSNEQALPTSDSIDVNAPPADVSPQTVSPQGEVPKFSLSFYPEGGNLLLGVANRMAFEGVDGNGRTRSFDGEVVDDLGQFVCSVNSIWDGKGFFQIVPVEGRSYVAVINGPDGAKMRFPLPVAQAEGLTMTVENAWQSPDLFVTVARASAENSEEPFFLLAMQDGRPKAAMRGVLSGGETSFDLSKADFGTGIVQITLFDARKMPRCERLVFINKGKRLSLSVSGVELPGEARGKVGLLLEARDAEGKPVVGDFAVSVTDADRIPSAAYRGADMVEYLALTSNLPGNVSDPSVFFELSRNAVLKADLLMMTNGWRRYNWQKVLRDTIQVPKYLEEPGIYVQGSLLRKSNLKSAPPGLEVIMLISNPMEVFSEKTGKQGDFTFLLRDFTDTLKAVVQTRNQMNNSKDYVIALASNLKSKPTDSYAKLLLRHPDEPELSLAPTSERSGLAIEKGELKKELTRALNNDFIGDSTAILIDEVTVTAKRLKSDKEKITGMYGAPDQSMGKKQLVKLVEDNPWQFGLMSILSDAIPGLSVDLSQSTAKIVSTTTIDKGTEVNMEVSDLPSVKFRLANKGPHCFLIFVDGDFICSSDENGLLRSWGQTDVVSELIGLDPEVVAAVDLVFPKKNSSGYGARPDDNARRATNAEAGVTALSQMQPSQAVHTSPVAVLSIYTVNGGGLRTKMHYKGIVNVTLQGFSKTKEFYRPNYGASTLGKAIVDKRNTLAWMPSVKTDSTGRADIVFFASDVSKNFRVEVNGSTTGGIPGSAVQMVSAPITEKVAITVGPALKDDAETTDHNVAPAGLPVCKVVMPDGSPAAFADVSVAGKAWGAFTNREGVFTVDTNIVSATDQVWVSKVGCQRTALTLPQMLASPTVLSAMVLEMSDLPADEVVKKMYGQMYKNRISRRFNNQGAYREQVFQGGQLVRLLDFGFRQRWPALGDNAAIVDTRLLAGRRFSVENYAKTVVFEPQNRYNDAVPMIDPFFSKLSFTDRVFRKNYQFNLVGVTEYQGRRMYLLSFDQTDKTPYAFYSGQLLVDAQTFGVAWVQWRVSAKGLEWVMPDVYLASGADQKTFKVLGENNEMGYSYNGEFWEPKFAVTDVSFARGGESGGYFREMFWYGTDQSPWKNKGLKMDGMKHRDMLIKAPKYNPQGWRNGWILPADSTIKGQVRFLYEVTLFAELDDF